MCEITRLAEGFQRKVIGAAAGIERLQTEIHRIGTTEDGGMERGNAARRSEQLNILHEHCGNTPKHEAPPLPAFKTYGSLTRAQSYK